jgi:phosphoglycerate dehydrogenase-like enzyme
LALLPRGAYVISVGRGEQLVESDLKALLDEGHLCGAALDVFEREPLPPDSWMWLHPVMQVTPHIAAPASREVVARQCLDALRMAREERAPLHCVDRTAGY